MLPRHRTMDCEALIRKLCPNEMNGLACYIVDSEDLPFNPVPNALAFTHNRLDLVLKHELQARGEWVGRGFATVVRTPLTVNLPGLVIHEFGHFLADRGWQQERDSEIAEAHYRQQPPESPRDQQSAHGATYIRALLHLQHRACALGCVVCFDGLQIDGRQGRRDLWTYQKALCAGWPGELIEAEMQGLSIAQVLGSPASQEFYAEFVQDLQTA